MPLPRAFIVEDEPDILFLLQQKSGDYYECCGTASSGEEAIGGITKAKPDIVFMDISLGGRIDGIAAAAQVRSRIDVPIIFVTAYSDPTTLERAKQAEPYGYLVKPFGEHDLRAAFEIALYKHRADMAMRQLEAQRCERAISEGSEIERRRMGEDLHDGLGQHLTGVAILCKALEHNLDGQPQAAEAARITSLVNEAILLTRRVARGLMPVDSEPLGLWSALNAMAEQVTNQSNVICKLLSQGDTRVTPPFVANHLYRIAQESVNNALKHAKPSRIDIRLLRSGAQGLLTIADDGRGLPADLDEASKNGLQIMHHRAQEIGGTLDVTSDIHGTIVTCWFVVEGEGS